MSYSTFSSTMAIALDSSGNARLAIFENPSGSIADFSGVALKQDPTAFLLSKITGDYSFGLVGWNGSSGSRSDNIGTFSADGLGNLNNGEIDGANMVLSPFTSNDFVVSSTGRGSAMLNVPGGQLPLNFYIVDSSHLLAIIQTCGRTGGCYSVAGEIIRQAGGPYSSASLSGTCVIDIQGWGITTPFTSSLAEVGLIAFDGVGSFSLYVVSPTKIVLLPTIANPYVVKLSN